MFDAVRIFSPLCCEGIRSTAQMVNTPPPVIFDMKSNSSILPHPPRGRASLTFSFRSLLSAAEDRAAALLLAVVWEISAALVCLFSNTMGLGGTCDACVPKLASNVSFQRGLLKIIDPTTL